MRKRLRKTETEADSVRRIGGKRESEKERNSKREKDTVGGRV